MKKLLIITIFLSLFTLVIAQEKDASKMEKFASRTGQIIKFYDYSLPDLKSNYTSLETKVRKFESAGEIEYFYQIVKEDKYDNKVASIAYDDLVEVLKALETLISNAEIDKSSNANYLENKFVTEDGFQVGYYAKKGSVNWYITLERYGSGNTVFISEVSKIVNAFTEAKNKIEQLRAG